MFAAFSKIISLLAGDKDSSHWTEQDVITGADVMRDSEGQASRDYVQALFDCSPLPVELVMRVLDLAEIWHRIGETPFAFPDEEVVSVQNGRRIVSATPPLTISSLHYLRRIIFRVTSRDQGWSSEPRIHHGTFENSWTWHEAEVTMQDSGTGTVTSKGIFELQRNRHASHEFADYCLVLNRNHDIFNTLSIGCVINLVACAQYPGWTNRVQHASIELQYFDMFTQTELQSHQDDKDGKHDETEQDVDALQESLGKLLIR